MSVTINLEYAPILKEKNLRIQCIFHNFYFYHFNPYLNSSKISMPLTFLKRIGGLKGISYCNVIGITKLVIIRLN